MKNQLLFIRMLTVAIMISPVLLFLFLTISYINSQNFDGISCGTIEYIAYDRSIRGTIVYTIGGKTKYPRKSLREWKAECSQLVYVEGSYLVNRDNACYIPEEDYFHIIINSESRLRSDYHFIPDVFVKCPYAE